MTNFTKSLHFILFSIIGIIISFVLLFILHFILIPDECYYESHNTNWLIELLYDFPSWNGCHPWPSNFHFGLIYFIGILIGFIFYKRYTLK